MQTHFKNNRGSMREMASLSELFQVGLHGGCMPIELAVFRPIRRELQELGDEIKVAETTVASADDTEARAGLRGSLDRFTELADRKVKYLACPVMAHRYGEVGTQLCLLAAMLPQERGASNIVAKHRPDERVVVDSDASLDNFRSYFL